ncbi:NAD(P)-dependent oxidoreductase [Nocardia brevicatena]|uniref:NAD(P)-dependent oxidoreductase n=1 Tax=Nocardia brevicatena TaxID=37327 RepID=UPI0002E6444B|nr:NAD(P)H-binding protein [Nocardia brevicatena]
MAAIAVLGATGRTGRVVVDRALARGHHVTAIVRPTTAAAPVRGATVVTVDPCAPGGLTGLLDDHDVVISALGATGRGPTTVYSDATAEIIAAMHPAGRLLVVSSAGLGVPADARPSTRLLAAVLRGAMRHTYSDMAHMERLLTRSELRWTAVRPTGLTDAPAGGRPRISHRPRARRSVRVPHEPISPTISSTPSTTRAPIGPWSPSRPDHDLPAPWRIVPIRRWLSDSSVVGRRVVAEPQVHRTGARSTAPRSKNTGSPG